MDGWLERMAVHRWRRSVRAGSLRATRLPTRSGDGSELHRDAAAADHRRPRRPADRRGQRGDRVLSTRAAHRRRRPAAPCHRVRPVRLGAAGSGDHGPGRHLPLSHLQRPGRSLPRRPSRAGSPRAHFGGQPRPRGADGIIGGRLSPGRPVSATTTGSTRPCPTPNVTAAWMTRCPPDRPRGCACPVHREARRQ